MKLKQAWGDKTYTLDSGLFQSQSVDWATPQALYEDLDKEFHFNDDPCPLRAMTDGLSREWGSRTYVNPPYGREIIHWIRKAYEESILGKIVVMLLPARTDTEWWHTYVFKASEIRFLRGRFKFIGAKLNAPIPSVIVVFKNFV